MKSKRKDALVIGDVFYDTGKPCKNGHLSKRYTVTGSCVACLKMNVKKDKEIYKKARLLKSEG